MMTNNANASKAITDRQQIRQSIRQARKALTPSQQQQAAADLVTQFRTLPELANCQHIAVYLHNDGEIATTPLIEALWQLGKTLYLPVLHPVVPGFLVFQRYQADTPMVLNQFKILEPALACQQIIPIANLEMILTPLVAFDSAGQRIGMGGGYYDRTFANQASAQQRMIGLAHNLQFVDAIPAEAWDVPLPKVVTPRAVHRFK